MKKIKQLKYLLYAGIMAFQILIVACNSGESNAVASNSGESNAHYRAMRAPLKQSKYVHLPLGAIKAQGWLRDQLQAQAEGLTSVLFSAFGTAELGSWRGNTPYHLEGVVSLAYTLDDERMRGLCEGYAERWLTHDMKDNFAFGSAGIIHFLMDYQEATGDDRVIPWMLNWYQRMSTQNTTLENWWENIGRIEHIVPMYWLYNQTGEGFLLSMAEEFFINEPPKEIFGIPYIAKANNNFEEYKYPKEDERHDHTHGVINSWTIKYPAYYYLQSKDTFYSKSVQNGIDGLDKYYGQVGGRFSAEERFPIPSSRGREPGCGTELCCIVEYAYSMERLFEIFGDPQHADRMESLIFNSFPGAMTGDFWAHQYDTQSNQVLVSKAKRFTSNGPEANLFGVEGNFYCCMDNIHKSWPRFTQNLWMATHDQGVIAVSYAPSKLNVKVGAEGDEVSINQETNYPFEEDVKLTISTKKSVKFPLYLRVPDWAKGSTVAVNGEIQKVSAGNIVKLNRLWKQGDQVSIHFPMPIRFEKRFNNSVSILRGPLYFASRIGGKYKSIEIKHLKKDKEEGFRKKGFPVYHWEIEPTTPWNYALELDLKNPEKCIEIETNKPGRYPFAHQGAPLFQQVQASNKSEYDKAPLKAELSEIDIHPAEPYLMKDGENMKPWRISDKKQHVAYRKINYDSREPIVLKVKARILPQWEMDSIGSAKNPPKDVETDSPLETIELIPYGCTRLRVAEFPYIETNK